MKLQTNKKIFSKFQLFITFFVFLAALFTFYKLFQWQKSYALANAINKEIETIKNTELTDFSLIQITNNQEKTEITNNEVFLVYLVSGCDACKKQVVDLEKINIQNKYQIFGVMSESEEYIKNFINRNNIKMPVLIDKNGEILKQLDLKYFPASLKIKERKIVDVHFGVPEESRLLGLLNFQ